MRAVYGIVLITALISYEEKKMNYLLYIGIALVIHIVYLFCLWRRQLVCQNGEKKKEQYSKWELSVGLVFSFILSIWMIRCLFLQVDNYINCVKMLLFYMILLICAGIDYKKKIIPNRILLIGLGARFILYVVEFVWIGTDIIPELCSEGIALLIVLLLMLVSTLTHKGIGMGDIKLMGLMSLYTGVFLVYSVLFVAALFGAIVGMVMIFVLKKDKKATIPFGPLLLIGYMAACIAGSY